jgi:hypothetical protein
LTEELKNHRREFSHRCQDWIVDMAALRVLRHRSLQWLSSGHLSAELLVGCTFIGVSFLLWTGLGQLISSTRKISLIMFLLSAHHQVQERKDFTKRILIYRYTAPDTRKDFPHELGPLFFIVLQFHK